MSGPVAIHRLEDPFGFARAARLCSGQFVIAAMPRLLDRLSGDDGTVSYVVRGGQDPLHRPQLELKITADLQMQCGRCLERMNYPLVLQTRLLLLHPGESQQEDDDPEAPEWLEAGDELDLQELIEDEILLGLPLATRHESGNCSKDIKGISGTDHLAAVEKIAPFANLALMLENRHKNKR